MSATRLKASRLLQGGLPFAALLALGGAIAVSGEGSNNRPVPQEVKQDANGMPLGTPPVLLTPPANGTVIADARIAANERMAEVTREYNEGRRDYRTLPVSVMDMATMPRYQGLDQLRDDAELVAAIEIADVSFYAAGYVDLPATRLTVHILASDRDAPADVALEMAGGPRRNIDTRTDEYLLLPMAEVPLAGDRYLAFAVTYDGVLVVNANGMVKLDGERVADTSAAKLLGIVGRPLEEVLLAKK